MLMDIPADVTPQHLQERQWQSHGSERVRLVVQRQAKAQPSWCCVAEQAAAGAHA